MKESKKWKNIKVEETKTGNKKRNIEYNEIVKKENVKKWRNINYEKIIKNRRKFKNE